MPLQLPTDLEAMVQKRLASGSYADAEEVLRLALEAQEAEEAWTPQETQALDLKIDRSLQQIAEGKTFGPEEARQKLAALREGHLTNLRR